MADPLSILGAASSASQLVEQGAKVIKFACEIYSRYQSPEKTQTQLAQVTQLVDLATLIKQNLTLQTSSMESCLDSCTHRIEEFQRILEKIAVDVSDSKWKRLKKSVETVLKEKEVIELFANLEREKSCLVLCIAEIDSSLLHSIGVDVKSMTETLGSVAGEVTDVKSMVLAIHERVIDPSNAPDDQRKSFFEVPNRRVRQFIGREDVLERIEQAFTSGAGPRVVVLRGLGGQGKTQVALEYCRRARAHGVQAIFWIDANSESTLKQSIQAIAGRVKNSSITISDEVAVDFVLGEFRDWPEPWMMVFDNYDDVKNFNNLHQYIPEGEQGCILITTRNTASDELADNPENVIELQGLAEHEAVDLLLKQCRAKQVSDGELSEAKAIVQRLVYHALAIAQAGSYIRQQKIRMNQFLEHYDAKLEKILKHTPQLSQYRRSLSMVEKETSLNVFTTWELSFQQLMEVESGELKGDLLTLFAFFDCKDISEQLFSAYCKRAQVLKNHDWPVACLTICLGEIYPGGQSLGGYNPDELLLNGKKQWSSDHFVDVLKDLAQLSLLQSWWRGDDNQCHFSLHPLVKDWIQLRIGAEKWRYCFQIAAKVLMAAISDGEYHQTTRHPPLVQQALLSHINIYEDNRIHLENIYPESQSYFQQERLDVPDGWFGGFAVDYGRDDKALIINQRVLEMREISLGKDNIDTLKAMDKLASTYLNVGEDEKAETYIRRAFDGKNAILGAEHPETLTSLARLAMILIDGKKFEEGKELAEQAWKGRENLFGPNARETLWCLYALANAVAGQEKFAEAEKLYRDLLLRQERILGRENKDTCNTLFNLGRVLRKQGKLDEAEDLIRQEIEVEQKLLHSNHPNLALSFWELGLVLKSQGRLNAAEEMMRRVLAAQEKTLGPYNRRTLKIIGDLADILREQNKLDLAEEMMRRKLEGREKTLGLEHKSTLYTGWDLAGILKEQKKLDLAEEMMRRTLVGEEKTLGPDHGNTTVTLLDLAGLLNEQRKYKEASLLYKRALPVAERMWGKEDSWVIECSEVYFDLLERLKATSE